MADHTEDPLFLEIEEDLRAERYAKLWKKYGKFVIAAVIALILGVSGYQGWRAYDLKVRTRQSDRFAAALKLLAENKQDQAQRDFAALANKADKGYRLLARLREASIMAKKGDKTGAQKIYETIAADTSLDKLYRDLGSLLSALVVLDTGAPAALRARLTPLTGADNPWRHSAQEALALLDLRAGKQKKAYDLLHALAMDATTPRDIRSRASELAAAVKP